MNFENFCKVLFKSFLASCLFCLNSYTCDIDGNSGFLPENDDWIPVSDINKAGGGSVSKRDFNTLIDEIADIYRSTIEGKGKTFVVKKNWTDGTVNAYAKQEEDVWTVAMFGGLARHEGITEDAMALVMCHELGHHLAGAPIYFDRFGEAHWASSEGQSDYWAGSKCFRKWAEDQNNRRIVRKLKAPELVVNACEKAHKEENDQRICIRVAMAGKSLANLFAKYQTTGKVIAFDTPSAHVVDKTDPTHPKGQCRLDTYYNSGLCDIHHTIDTSFSDQEQGTCNRRDGYSSGVRPLCWFKPRY